MNNSLSIIKIIIVFTIAFSLAGLSASTSSPISVPMLHPVHAVAAPCSTHTVSGACSEYWIPAGPSMDTFLAKIFIDENAEFTDIQSPSPSIDLTDFRLDPSIVPNFQSSSNFYLTAPISEHGYYELQFMMANNFWGVNFNYGSDPNGLQIRQGIAHLIDKATFASTEPALIGSGIAIDNAVPASNGGLPGANPCNWDQSFIESGSNCTVGAPGGTAYHLATATGGSHGLSQWQPYLGDPDFCAAAQHFINAGLATGKSPTTCVLTGVPSSVGAHTVNLFVRSDDPARYDFGNGLAQDICALFTGSFTTTNCLPYLSTTTGPITEFAGFQTSATSVSLSWWMYTAGYLQSYPYDQSLYLVYHSRFVSGISSILSPSGLCSPAAVPSNGAGNYMYICDSGYDAIADKMEFAPCPSASGDPSVGQAVATFATCPATTSLTAISAGYQAEDRFGQNAYTIPIFAASDRFGYLHNWQRVVNNDGTGIANTFTWMNAYSATPALSGTIRQGFKQSTTSLNPYIASTVWDFYILSNIYDSLSITNPLANGELIDWMAVSSQQLPNSQLSYSPPAGTVSSYRFTLRSDMFWQDGQKVTSWDVKFSYLTLKSTGAFQGAPLAPMTGVTVLSNTQFDINVNAFGPFTKLSITSPTIFPGHLWSTCAGSVWNTYASAGNVPNSCMSVPASKIVNTFDPLQNGILVGSGPWQCNAAPNLGKGCSSTGFENPPINGAYVLTRYGKGFPPNSPPFNVYFRSSSNLALWIWTMNTGVFTQDFVIFTTAAACFNLPVTTSAPCAHYQNGIGSANGTAGPASIVGINQVLSINRFVGVDWVSPGNWQSALPPTGIIPLSPILYEGSVTLSPCTMDPVHGYDC